MTDIFRLDRFKLRVMRRVSWETRRIQRQVAFVIYISFSNCNGLLRPSRLPPSLDRGNWNGVNDNGDLWPPPSFTFCIVLPLSLLKHIMVVMHP